MINLLYEKKADLLTKWIDRTLATYSQDALRIFRKEKDRFANPIGYHVSSTLENIYEVLCNKKELEAVIPKIDQLIKIRAVQEFTPGEAVAFLFDLKQLVKEEVRKSKKPELHSNGWFTFDEMMDRLAIIIFERYMAARELIYKVREKELRSGNFALTDGVVCPSALLRKNGEQQADKDKINIHSQQK